MNHTTLLAILQQSEYDPRYFHRWWKANHQANILVSPKKWTLKLRCIALLSRVWFWLPPHQQILLAAWMLNPVDWLVKTSLIWAAKLKLQILRRQGMKVVAFSGSYGKTSTKKIAHHVLSAQTATQATPKSINTPLGIAQFILKHLQPQTRVFLVELGEYYPGDILALAQLIAPDLSVVCPVGHQHLERMESLEKIAHTVLELATYHAYHPAKVLIHESLMPYVPAGLSSLPLTYGIHPASDYQVTQAQVSWAGTDGQLQLTKTAKAATAFTPLFGAHQLVNSLPALWLCTQLGLNPEQAVRQLGSTPYVPHRHQPIFTQTNMLILDNGYNSNPDAATISLQLLKSLPATQRLVITPGFAELGEQADRYHFQFGQQLAGVVDSLGLIQSAGLEAIKKGFLQAGGQSEQIVMGVTQTEVAEKMAHLFKPQTVLLFENNLPEVYN